VSVTIVPAEVAHIAPLAETMREADVVELQASCGLSPLEALTKGWCLSDLDMSFTALDSAGRPVAMFGANCLLPQQDTWGCAWMLTSKLLDVSNRTVWAYSKHYTQLINARYPVITNWVDDRNSISHAWLTKLGFFPALRIPEYGHEKRPFTQYVRLQ
jgi:hypothetical protein